MKTHLWCITTLLISSSSLVHADSFLELSHSNEWTALEEVLIPDPEKNNSRNIQTFSELEKAVSKNSHEVMSKMDPTEIALAQQRYETLGSWRWR